MRCLYCGKELALLKRWTGGGEFCSDAHRQQYQEEYNQLALNRLLQAKPKADVKRDVRCEGAGSQSRRQGARSEDTAPATSSEAPAASPRLESGPATLIPAAVPQRPLRRCKPEAVVQTLESSRSLRSAPLNRRSTRNPAPAEAHGFFVELPVPVDAPVAPPVCELGGFDQPHPTLLTAATPRSLGNLAGRRRTHRVRAAVCA